MNQEFPKIQISWTMLRKRRKLDMSNGMKNKTRNTSISWRKIMTPSRINTKDDLWRFFTRWQKWFPKERLNSVVPIIKNWCKDMGMLTILSIALWKGDRWKNLKNLSRWLAKHYGNLKFRNPETTAVETFLWEDNSWLAVD